MPKSWLNSRSASTDGDGGWLRASEGNVANGRARLKAEVLQSQPAHPCWTHKAVCTRTMKAGAHRGRMLGEAGGLVGFTVFLCCGSVNPVLQECGEMPAVLGVAAQQRCSQRLRLCREWAASSWRGRWQKRWVGKECPLVAASFISLPASSQYPLRLATLKVHPVLHLPDASFMLPSFPLCTRLRCRAPWLCHCSPARGEPSVPSSFVLFISVGHWITL